MSDTKGLSLIVKADTLIGLHAKIDRLNDEIECGQKNLGHAWSEVGRLKKLLEAALEAESNANAQLNDLEDLLLSTLHEADCRQCQRFIPPGQCNSVLTCLNGDKFISAPFFLIYKSNEVAFND